MKKIQLLILVAWIMAIGGCTAKESVCGCSTDHKVEVISTYLFGGPPIFHLSDQALTAHPKNKATT